MLHPRIRDAVIIAAFLVLPACVDDSPTSPSPDVRDKVLADLTREVILDNYAGFKGTTVSLASASAAFAANPSDLGLAMAQDAWQLARPSWELAKAFGFGPADIGGFDTNVDSWPVNLVDLELVFQGAATIDEAYIDSLDVDLKGFHAIEYVLYGVGGSKTASDFAARELEYLVAATTHLADQASGLFAAWDLTSGYGHELISAGDSNSVYANQADAFQDLAQGMIVVAKELGTDNLAGPLGPPFDPGLLESRFSNNTGADLVNNLLGVFYIYEGRSGGMGLKDLVETINPEVDADITAALGVAHAALIPIGYDLEVSMVANPTGVQAAIDAFAALQLVLTDELLPAVTQ